MSAPPLPLEEAQARLLALAEPLPVQRVDVASCLGRYLAEPLTARRTQPAFDLSAMDGYAVRADDLAGPWRVVGESAAGRPADLAVAPGTAVRISTGAILPDEAGAVILQEDVARRGEHLELTGEPPSPPGRHIRRRGMDFAEGDRILAAGARIGPAAIGLAIAAGHRHLAVRRPPRLTIVDSGDDLASDCEACPPYQIPASNGPMLAALATSALSCDITRLGPVRDDLGSLRRAFDRAAAADADVIVTIGGASVGDHDLIRPALAEWGAAVDFWRVAIKPGKPLLVARKAKEGAGNQIVLGLPGNPASSHVTAFLFLLPLLRALAGATATLPLPVTARLAAPLPAGGSRREFLRGRWDGTCVAGHALQDSGALAALAAANALIDRPAGAPAAEAGDTARVYLLACADAA
jgi:molybdopterin molybdotransferase